MERLAGCRNVEPKNMMFKRTCHKWWCSVGAFICTAGLGHMYHLINARCCRMWFTVAEQIHLFQFCLWFGSCLQDKTPPINRWITHRFTAMTSSNSDTLRAIASALSEDRSAELWTELGKALDLDPSVQDEFLLKRVSATHGVFYPLATMHHSYTLTYLANIAHMCYFCLTTCRYWRLNI